MKVSTKTRYALRILIYLADNYPLGYIPLKAITQNEALPQKYAEQLMRKLEKSGFVTSARGINGGYKLTTPPYNINVHQILYAMEVSNQITPCSDFQHIDCINAKDCAAADIWQLLQATIDELLENISLTDILRTQQQKTGKDSLYLSFLSKKELIRHEKRQR